MTAPATSEPSAIELSEQAVSIMAMATTLARRGMPSPARWSRTIGPTVGRSSTQRSKRGLDRAKHAAASTKNPVVGRPGTTMPTVPSATAANPSTSRVRRTVAGYPTRVAMSRTIRTTSSAMTVSDSAE